MQVDPADIVVELSGDRMEASLTLTHEHERGALGIQELQAALDQKGVTYGIDRAALKRIADNRLINLPFVVARGTKSEDGRNEEIEYKFATAGSAPVEQSEAGSIDFRSIRNFNNSRAGTVLAVKQPATEGKPGRTVTGEELAVRNGKAASFKIGKGARLVEDGMSVVAEIDGHACLVGDRINVLNTVEIPANVDYSVGNINFIGNVRVRGGVMPGFSVVAEGDLEISENVEKANIKCGGNLTIRGIVFGQGNCLIEVAGSAVIGAVDQAQLLVKGDLTVNNYIRHSKVLSGGLIELTGKKGTIVGGEISAFRGINAPFVGNSMATFTKLTVGCNPFISSELDNLRARINETESRLGQIGNALKTVLSRLAANREDTASQAMYEKLKRAREQLEPELETMTRQLGELQAMSAEYKDAKIRIGEVVYPGVVMNFREHMQYKTLDEAQHLTFYEDAAEIRTGPY